MTSAPDSMAPQVLSASPSGGGGGGPGLRFTPIDPIRVLKQYKWLLVIAAVAGVVIGAALFFVLRKVAPRYTAKSTILVSGELADPWSPSGGGFGRREDLETFKLTQAYYIGSLEVLDKTLEQQLEVKKTSWFTSFGDRHRDRLEDFEQIVAVVPVRNTSIIEVRVSLPQPTEASTVCNALVRQYRAMIERDNRTRRGQVTALFTAMRRQKQEDIDSLRQRIDEAMSAVDYSYTENRFHEIESVFQELIKERYEVAQMLQITRHQYEGLIEAQQAQDFDFSQADYAQVDADPIIKSRDDRIMALQEELRVARERFGPNHRTVKDLEFRIDAIRVEKQRERERLLRELWKLKVSEAESQLGGLTDRLKDIDERLASVREQRRELNAKISDYRALRDELERREDESEQFESMLSSMALLRDDPRAVRVQIQSPATPPDFPSFPKIQVMVPGATVLVLGLVGGLVFLKELLDQRIKSPSCARMLPDADLLGVIPHAGEDPSGHDSIEMVVIHEPASLMTEAFRQLRTEVVTRLERRGQKTMMVVGSQARCGVSSVAANLAASIAMNNRRVVLIDANFRRPALHEMFGLPDAPGMAELLSGAASIDQAVQSTRVPNLDVLCIGRDREKVFESLEGPACQSAFSQMEHRYDLILVDAPPLSIVGDSRLLGNQVDAVLLVVRAMADKRGLVSRVMRQLKQVRGELIGITLNAVRTSAGGYFRDNYRAFYEYQAGASASRGPRGRRGSRPTATARSSDAADSLADAADDRET